MEKRPKTPRKRLKILHMIFEYTGATEIWCSFLIFVFVDAALIWAFEPTIKSYGDALWYCYAVISTAGFGDVVVTTFIPKVLSVLLTADSLLSLAIFTGVVVNYFTRMAELKNKDTLTAFLDELERLPEMDEDELRDMSERVKHFRKNWGKSD
jgi:voltage-gated potassium channel